VGGLAAVGVASILAGSAVATSNASLPVVAILTIAVAAAALFAIAGEVVLVALIATSPIGFEQFTAGERSLLESYGGWAVSSVRLGVLLLVGLAVLAVRGLPRRLVAGEYVYLALVAWVAATLVFSPDLLAGVRFTAKLAVLPVAWLAFGWVIRRFGERFMWHLLLVTLAGALVIDYGLIALGENFHHYPDAGRRFAGLAEPASGALSLAALALAALFLWFRDRNRVALVLYVLAWTPILMSVTRIAIFGFAVSSILLAALMRRWLETATITLLIAVTLVSYAPFRERMAFGPDAQSWRTVTATFQSEGLQGLNTEGRTELWSVLARKFHEHPIEGSGVGTSEAVLRANSTFGGVAQAHSDYMALLVNGGVVALMLWLGAVVGLAVRFARTGGAAAPAAAVLLMYLVAAVTDNTIEMYAQLGIPLAALVAIALATRERTSDAGRRPGSGPLVAPAPVPAK
jgi:hypothetical protein